MKRTEWMGIIVAALVLASFAMADAQWGAGDDGPRGRQITPNGNGTRRPSKPSGVK